MQALLFIYSSNARTLDNMSSFVAEDHRIDHLTLTQNFHLVLNEACMPLTNFKGSMMYHNTQAECWGNSKRLEGKESWSNEMFFRGDSTWALVLEGRLGKKMVWETKWQRPLAQVSNTWAEQVELACFVWLMAAGKLGEHTLSKQGNHYSACLDWPELAHDCYIVHIRNKIGDSGGM